MVKIPDLKMINDIIHNYVSEERSMVSQLYFKYRNHGTTVGGFREDLWKEMFENIVPKKFVVEQSVFIIDSNGQVSKEVDIAIFDEMYTPYIFRKGKLKFIPIEAVAVVVECKSTSGGTNSLKEWTQSIKNLNTSRKAITRMHSGIITENGDGRKLSQTATRPILVYCYLGDKREAEAKLFDFALHADEEQGRILIYYEENSTLKDWYRDLNHADDTVKNGLINEGIGFEDEDNLSEGTKKTNYHLDEYLIETNKKNEKLVVSLLSFNFMLNQLLMLINNPILFPHMAYVEMFNKNTWNEDGVSQTGETS